LVVLAIETLKYLKGEIIVKEFEASSDNVPSALYEYNLIVSGTPHIN
jgi:hypothetical protein